MKDEKKTPLAITDLQTIQSHAIPVFQKVWERGKKNEDIKQAENWSAKAKAAFRTQGRQAYSLPMIATKINTILATQRANRTDFKIEAAADPNDEIKAELATLQIRDLQERNDFAYKESDVFDDGISVAFGAMEIYLDQDRMFNTIAQVRQLDYLDVIWDPSSKEFTHSDALWMAKINRMYRFEVEKEYGKGADDLSEGQYNDWGRAYVEHEEFYIKPNLTGKPEYDVISVFTHYQRVNRKYYYVVFPDPLGIQGMQDNPVAGKFRSKAEAERKLRELEVPYLLKYGIDPQGQIAKRTEAGIDKYIFTYDRILDYEETELNDFPISIYHSFQYKNKFWTLADLLKSPQEFIDRLYAQIDFSFGKDVKNVMEGNLNALADNETPESAQDKASKTGGIIWTKGQQVFHPIPFQGANPQWIEVAEIMQKLIEDFTGGRSFQGLQEGSSESGKAIALKQAAGSLLTSLFIDNLQRWKKDIGKKILWHMQKYETSARLIKFGGGAISPEMLQLLQQQGLYQPSLSNKGTGYVRINADELSYLKDADFELKVTEVQLSEVDKQRRLAQLDMLAQRNPMIAQLPSFMELYLTYADIDFTDRQKLMDDIKQQQLMQQQMAEQQALQERNTQAETTRQQAQQQRDSNMIALNNQKIQAAKMLIDAGTKQAEMKSREKSDKEKAKSSKK